MKRNADRINQDLRLFWIAMGGKEDIAYKNCHTMLAKFGEMKVKYTDSRKSTPCSTSCMAGARMNGGGHTWPVWRGNLYSMAALLFK